ncbi:MAG: lipopolysaccharide biosynthesis protein [Pseudomonadota bacterium]
MLLRFAATLGVRGGAAAASFLMHMLIANLLGAEGVGLFALTLVAAQGLADLGRFGLNQTVVRHAAPHLASGAPEAARPYIATAFTVPLCLAGAAAALACGLSLSGLGALWLGSSAHAGVLAAMVWSAPPLALMMVAGGVLQASGRPAVASFVEAGALPLGLLALLGTSLLAGAPRLDDPLSMTLAYVAAAGGAALLGAALAPARLMDPRRADGPMLRASHPILTAHLLGYAMRSAPLLAVGLFGTLEEAGLFSVAWRAAMLLTILLTAINTVMARQFAVAWGDGDAARLQREFDLSLKALLGLGLPAVAVLGLAAGPALSLFGAEFAEARGLLWALLAGQIGNLATASGGSLLMMTGHERALRWNMAVCAAATVALSLALTPIWGAAGAAAAASLSLTLQGALAAWQAARLAGVRLLWLRGPGAAG